MSEQPVQPDGVLSPAEIHEQRVTDPAAAPVEVEALQESGPEPVKTVAVEMGNGVAIQVPMQSAWRVSALTAMRGGDFESWAELVLTDADLDEWDEWYGGDPEPTLGEVQEFFERLGKATGQATGNRASRRASARTPRR